MPNVTTKITIFESEVADLKRQLTLLADLLENLGLQPWLAPGQAATFLGMSRDSLVRDIRHAEELRQAGKIIRFPIRHPLSPKAGQCQSSSLASECTQVA